MIILQVWKSQAFKSDILLVLTTLVSHETQSLGQKYLVKSIRYQFESLSKQWKCSQDCVQVL